jgi:heme/copper-type cytochrome/quinol oxidase subunit 2
LGGRSGGWHPPLAGVTLIALAGCTEDLSVVHPAGPAAAAIATLWWVLLGGAVAIFAFVMGLVVLAFRTNGPAAPEAEPGLERRWIIGLGLVFPGVVLAALLAYGLVIGERLLPRGGTDVVHVSAEARQWAWRFAYPGLRLRTTDDILHIPAGRPVDVQITSLDVIHSFWVPRLAGKLDAIPGHVNVLRIEADLPGTYAGVSAEFSGTGYRRHSFVVMAHDAEAWATLAEGVLP